MKTTAKVNGKRVKVEVVEADGSPAKLSEENKILLRGGAIYGQPAAANMGGVAEQKGSLFPLLTGVAAGVGLVWLFGRGK